MSTVSVRERLTAAAFALFDECGYDQTTVEQIAGRAGVSRTTFFRSFAAKEDVIFPDHDVLLGAVAARLATATESSTEVAVREAAHLVLAHYLAEGSRARSRYRLISTVPALRGREIAGIQQYQRLFRQYIHAWMGGTESTTLRAELMATAVVSAHNHVLRRWLRADADQPEAEFDQAMDDVIALFASTPTDPGAVVVLRTTADLDRLLPSLRGLLATSEPSSKAAL
jgi:AcrR family transcriptional regulator